MTEVNTPNNTNGTTLQPGMSRSKKVGIVVLIILAVLVAIAIKANNTPHSSSTAAPSGTSDKTFTSENYGELATSPGSFKGATVDFDGKVLKNAEVTGNQSHFQVWADPEHLEWNTVVHGGPGSKNLKSGDLVHVQGKVKGEFAGENAFGAKLKVPEINATNVIVTKKAQKGSK